MLKIAPATKDRVMASLPLPLRFGARYLLRPDEGRKWVSFLRATHTGESLADRWALMNRFYDIHTQADCRHTQYEMVTVLEGILSVPLDVPGCIVEAGVFKGGSAAKFSLAAEMTQRKLFLFDSFEGIPDNDEVHGKTIFGHEVGDAFAKGTYRGGIEEVKETLSRFGRLDRCEFVKGWFEDTMPGFNQPIVAAYLDVDLASSTRTCLKYLYPLLVKGGKMYSQDAHLPLVIEVLEDRKFWQEEVGWPMPRMEGLGTSRLVTMTKI